MDAVPSAAPAVTSYVVRRLRPADAGGVARLVKLVYGDSYYPPDLYDPETIVRRDRDGTLVCVVALDPAGRVVHTPTRHRDMLSRIYRQFGATVELPDDVPAAGAGRVAVECEPAVGAGTIRVPRVGSDTPEAVRRASRDLCECSGARAV